MALLFLTAPLVPALRQLTRGFTQIASTGYSSPGQVLTIATVAARQLRFMIAAALIATWSAAGAQSFVTRNDHGIASIPEDVSRAEGHWGGLVLVASSMLAIPVSWVVYSAMRIISVIKMVSAPGLSGEELDAIVRTVLAGTGGAGELIGEAITRSFTSAIALIPILLVFSIASIAVIARRKAPTILTRYSWLVLALVTLAGVSALITLSTNAR